MHIPVDVLYPHRGCTEDSLWRTRPRPEPKVSELRTLWRREWASMVRAFFQRKCRGVQLSGPSGKFPGRLSYTGGCPRGVGTRRRNILRFFPRCSRTEAEPSSRVRSPVSLSPTHPAAAPQEFFTTRCHPWSTRSSRSAWVPNGGGRTLDHLEAQPLRRSSRPFTPEPTAFATN